MAQAQIRILISDREHTYAPSCNSQETKLESSVPLPMNWPSLIRPPFLCKHPMKCRARRTKACLAAAFTFASISGDCIFPRWFFGFSNWLPPRLHNVSPVDVSVDSPADVRVDSFRIGSGLLYEAAANPRMWGSL
jgi:hypothetical protein